MDPSIMIHLHIVYAVSGRFTSFQVVSVAAEARRARLGQCLAPAARSSGSSIYEGLMTRSSCFRCFLSEACDLSGA